MLCWLHFCVLYFCMRICAKLAQQKRYWPRQVKNLGEALVQDHQSSWACVFPSIKIIAAKISGDLAHML